MKEKDTLLQYRFDEKVSEGFADYGYIPHQFFVQADFVPPKPPYTLRMTEIRKEHRLTQSDVAQILSTSQKQYSRWETGKSSIPIETLSTFALYFNVSIDFLLGFTLDKSPVFTREERRRRIKAMKLTPYFNQGEWWFLDENGVVEPEYEAVVEDIKKRRAKK